MQKWKEFVWVQPSVSCDILNVFKKPNSNGILNVVIPFHMKTLYDAKHFAELFCSALYLQLDEMASK